MKAVDDLPTSPVERTEQNADMTHLVGFVSPLPALLTPETSPKKNQICERKRVATKFPSFHHGISTRHVTNIWGWAVPNAKW